MPDNALQRLGAPPTPHIEPAVPKPVALPLHHQVLLVPRLAIQARPPGLAVQPVLHATVPSDLSLNQEPALEGVFEPPLQKAPGMSPADLRDTVAKLACGKYCKVGSVLAAQSAQALPHAPDKPCVI